MSKSMMFSRAIFVVPVFVVLLGSTAVDGAEFRFEHEHVLGTSLELTFEAPSRAVVTRVERAVLGEIDRLNAVLSGYDEASEVSRWQRGGVEPSADLRAVLARAEHWRAESDGAFDVRAEALIALWRNAAEQGVPVDDVRRREIVRTLSMPPYSMEGFERIDDLPIRLDALAKGYIIDAVCDLVAERFDAVSNLTVNIGGDLRTSRSGMRVAVTDPRDAAVGASPLVTFELADAGAVATSGNYRRFVAIEGRRRSHIVDPRTGLPTGHVASATVLAPRAVDADALATIASVFKPAESLRLIESLEATECLLVLADGSVVGSAGWPASRGPAGGQLVFFDDSKAAEEEDADDEKAGLHVSFTLERARGGAYRRPYVAIWLEDEKGFPVKTAVLWVMAREPGPRWHRDLRRWYVNDRKRILVDDKSLVDTISGATRGPGEYEARFDGTDDLGRPLRDAEYTLCLEVAREKGTYQIIREKVDWKRDRAIARKSLKGNVEMGDVSYEYVPAADGGNR